MNFFPCSTSWKTGISIRSLTRCLAWSKSMMPLNGWKVLIISERSFSILRADMETVLETTVNGFTYSTDKTRLDIGFIHQYLSERSYWAQGIPREVVVRGIENA